MQEAEVSLYIALHYIRNGLTNENVKVSISIFRYYPENNCGLKVKRGKPIEADKSMC